jgi:hypothetical protein
MTDWERQIEEWKREDEFDKWCEQLGVRTIFDDFATIYVAIGIGIIGGVVLGIGLLVYQAIVG